MSTLFFKLDTSLYLGYFQITDSIIINKSWDYGVYNPIPEYIEVPQGRMIRKLKIFNKYDFIKYKNKERKKRKKE